MSKLLLPSYLLFCVIFYSSSHLFLILSSLIRFHVYSFPVNSAQLHICSNPICLHLVILLSLVAYSICVSSCVVLPFLVRLLAHKILLRHIFCFTSFSSICLNSDYVLLSLYRVAHLIYSYSLDACIYIYPFKYIYFVSL
jgi:hypothetical protein